MAAINQIKLSSNNTTYDVNDKRITTTAVTTATHFLTTDSSVSSIAPITAANAASVLGGVWYKGMLTSSTDLNALVDVNDIFCYKLNRGASTVFSNSPINWGYWYNLYEYQIAMGAYNASDPERMFFRYKTGNWREVSAVAV